MLEEQKNSRKSESRSPSLDLLAELTSDPLTNAPLVLTVHALDDREAGMLQKKIRR